MPLSNSWRESQKRLRAMQRDAADLGQINTELTSYYYSGYTFFWLSTDSDVEYVEVYDSHGNDYGYFYISRADEDVFPEMCHDHCHESGE